MPRHLLPYDLISEPTLPGGGELQVSINGKLLEDLDRLAIDPVWQFRGAVVRVTGTIRGARTPAPGVKQDRQMVVIDFDKFRVVQPPQR